jgi:hypothetical protein
MLKKESGKVKPRPVKKAEETLLSATDRLGAAFDDQSAEQECCAQKNAPSKSSEGSPLPVDAAILQNS